MTRNITTHLVQPEDITRPNFSVVVPVYRGRATVVELCRRLECFFESRGGSYEIVFVDDGSTDGSWNEISRLADESTHVLGVRLMKNFGQHNATNCGLALARGDFIVTLDEDLQHLPEEISNLIECQQREEADVVYGIPLERMHGWWRKLGSRIAMLIPRYVMQINFDISSFRLIRRSVAEVVSTAIRHDIIIDVYISWTTNRVASTRVKHAPARPSTYGPYTLAALMFHMLCNYTVLPLRISAALGGILSSCAFIAGSYFVVQKLVRGIDVPGFTAIIVTLLVSTGLLLMSIGAASEYLARVFLCVNRKPQWVIREATSEDRLDRDL